MKNKMEEQTMNTKYVYSAHGLRIKSYRSLPSIAPADGAGDFDVEVQSSPLKKPKKVDKKHRTISDKGKGITIYWKDRVTMKIENGKKILVDQLSGADDKLTGFLIIGTGLGVLLHQRQRTTLHASAVVLDGDAIAFAGKKGMGKSTTAAAFMRKGFHVISDDVLSPIIYGGTISVAPSERSFKLWPDAADTVLGSESENLSLLHPKAKKKVYSIGSNDNEWHPLRRIYILEYDEKKRHECPCIETISGKEAYIEITKNSYALRFLGKKGLKKWYSNDTSFIAKNIEVKKIFREKSNEKIDDTVKKIIEDSKSKNEHAI